MTPKEMAKWLREQAGGMAGIKTELRGKLEEAADMLDANDAPNPESCLNCRNYQRREYTEAEKKSMHDDYLHAMNYGMKATAPDYNPRMVCARKGWLRDWDAAIVRCEDWAATLTEAEKMEADRQRLNALVSKVEALEQGLMEVKSSISNYGTRNQRRYMRLR